MLMDKLARWFKLFLGLFPQPLPRGVSELNNFYTNFFSMYDIPDLASYRLALATMMMHMGPTTAYKSPFWFYRSIRAAQAKETAYQVIAEDREARNKEEREAKQAAYDTKMAQSAAVTASQQVDANGQSPQTQSQAV